jgi:malonyl CoA-acyl carrier protein transacylase
MEEDFFSQLTKEELAYAETPWKSSGLDFCGSTEVRFVHFLRLLSNFDVETEDLKADVFLAAVEFFWEAVLCGDDVHVFAAQEQPERPEEIVSTLWNAAFLAQNISSWRIPISGPPKFDSAIEGFVFVFGGQGHDYFPSLVTVYNTYPFCQDLVRGFLALISTHLAESDFPVSLDNCIGSPLPDEILQWPSISCPLIGLLQLTNFYVLCKLWGVDPGFFCSMRGATFLGHSQGSVTALALSGCSSMEDFFKSARSAITLLTRLGIRVQEDYPITDGNSMMLVTGLEESSLREVVDPLDIPIVVQNTKTSFVLADYPNKLTEAAAKLGNVTGARAKFLPVKAPFHSERHLNHIHRAISLDVRAFNIHFLSPTATVASGYTGKPVQLSYLDGTPDLDAIILDLLSRRVDWLMSSKTILGPSTLVIDFGPGCITKANLQENFEGLVVSLESFQSTKTLCKCDLFRPHFSATSTPKKILIESGVLRSLISEGVSQQTLSLAKQSRNPLQPEESFDLDSLENLGLVSFLENELKIKIPVNLVYDFPTANSLASHLRDVMAGEKSMPSQIIGQNSSCIVISGFSGRVPCGKTKIEDFGKVFSSNEIRLENLHGTSFLHGSIGFEGFDYQFFRLSPREARSMDPQQGVFAGGLLSCNRKCILSTD